MFRGVNRLKTDAFYMCVAVNYHFSSPFNNHINEIYANSCHRSSQGNILNHKNANTQIIYSL
jgi:hypothetical protein